MKTGVFFHDIFRGKEWLIIGDKFRRFPGVMKKALRHSDVQLFEPRKVDEALLLKVHTQRLVQNLRDSWYYEAALYSVGGCVEATERVLAGEIENALVFTVAAGHHAERDSAWGGTYVSCAGPSFYHAREKFGLKRFAILDTDRHHGNGTRDIFLMDNDVLHICFCHQDLMEGDGSKICVNTAFPNTNEAYMKQVTDAFIPRIKDFKPDLILHNFGHDTCQLDYGDIGLTPDFYPRLAREIKTCAKELCRGRYIVLTHGGQRADVAETIFPRIAEILVEK